MGKGWVAEYKVVPTFLEEIWIFTKHNKSPETVEGTGPVKPFL